MSVYVRQRRLSVQALDLAAGIGSHDLAKGRSAASLLGEDAAVWIRRRK